MTPDILKESPAHFRAGIARGAEQVQREGGLFGAGMIAGVSVISRGEAEGHDLWVDQEFLSDVTAAINGSDAENGGVKARFTHPGLSSDGLGSRLGRVTNAKTTGDRVVADLHLLKAARTNPDGDLAEHVLGLAEEDPDSFGVSIVFDRDLDREAATIELNTFNGRFVSPDEDNRHNFAHARLDRLRAADVVDDPAANPTGLFHTQQEAASEAEAVLSYALGLTGEKPSAALFDVDPDRVLGFVRRFLDRHQLKLEGAEMTTEKKPDAPANEAPPAPVVEAPTRAEFAAELAAYAEVFGAKRGLDYFSRSLNFEAARAVFEDDRAQIEALTAKIAELEETLNAIPRGEEQPADYQDGETAAPRTFNSKIRISGKNYDRN